MQLTEFDSAVNYSDLSTVAAALEQTTCEHDERLRTATAYLRDNYPFTHAEHEECRILGILCNSAFEQAMKLARALAELR